MPTDLYIKIYNFLLNAEEEDITAGSVIHQGIEDNLWISQNELKSIIKRAVAFVKNQYERGSLRHTTLLKVLSEEKCDEFVVNFAESNISVLPQKLSHNREWKESDEELADFAKSQNEGTYMTNVIVPAIRATLKSLPLGRSSYVSSAERQSSASANRKGEGQTERRSDIMFVMKHDGKKYELIYVESSCLSCTPQKEKDDEIKLWRETNDGMYWMHKSSRPDKDEFGIIGIQVAGRIMRLNVLIRDVGNVHHYYHLYEAEIPVQQSDPSTVTNFVKTLLILQNILIVNMSLLLNTPSIRSKRNKDSSNVDSK
ncbi:hypothetical protein C1646_773652 [Rhizophagus diaphanus]|nr:hypothetical protein C1646_773652 [Rhizophagus diaphanus] [Rhizophagus sp. MUCL 43196]